MIAVVPAHNEEQTVGRVASALISAGVFSHVIVVDDGSSDATAEEARATGADVLTLSSNRGKAGAMLAGLEAHHVKIMADHFALGFITSG